jgi:DNA-binding MarR family transcriptional regulator
MPQTAEHLSSILHLLHRASQRADAIFGSHMPDSSPLTPRQLAVLQAVAQKDGLSQTDIMNATGIDRSSTAELVRRLVKSGWLQRRRTRRDGRVYAIRITTPGRELLAIGKPVARVVGETLLLRLPPADRSKFLKALMLIAAAPAEQK